MSFLTRFTLKTVVQAGTEKATAMVRVMLCLVCIITIWSHEIRAEQEYLFVGQENYAPFNLVDEQGKLTGLDVEIIQRAAEVAGVKVKIKVYPWAGALKLVKTARRMACLDVARNQIGKNFSIIPKPLSVMSNFPFL